MLLYTVTSVCLFLGKIVKAHACRGNRYITTAVQLYYYGGSINIQCVKLVFTQFTGVIYVASIILY